MGGWSAWGCARDWGGTAGGCSLTFAVGAYLSIATTLAICVGGVVRWMVDTAMHRHAARQTSYGARRFFGSVAI